ncbi:MAG TPA: HWE histidine kinase domain-containing protein [Hyphomicrobium sp.]|nr:HWE histidine kinase domain-containing protein [Hyphomicrobium sp.]
MAERPAGMAVLADFLLAGGLVSVAFIVRWLLGFAGERVLVFAVCFPAVLAATLIAGFRCGIMSLFISTILFSWAFISPTRSFALMSFVDVLNIALYVAVGAVIIWIGHLYRRMVERLRAAKSKNELLMRELSHRSKNSLAVLSAIISQSLRHDPAQARKIIGRVAALKLGEELMLEAEVAPIALRDLLARELTVYEVDRLTLDGTQMAVPGDLAKTLSMVVHELATNALKYGAWSTDVGRVSITWGAHGQSSYLRWAEDGGPAPTPPEKVGFGTFLIERLIAGHHGQANMECRPSGIIWHLTFANPADQDSIEPAANTAPVTA